MPADARFAEIAAGLAALGRRAYQRGWASATSGNFSAVVSEKPLRVAITATGRDKGTLDAADILAIDERAGVVAGPDRPSAETALHLAILRARGAGAVLHTHSLWSTLLSEAHAAAGGLAIEGYEMQKALHGVRTHQSREWLPIIDNSQDWAREAPAVEALLAANPAAHGFLIRRHGLYTWGRDLAEASRHLEALEFLLEAVGRTHAWQA